MVLTHAHVANRFYQGRKGKGFSMFTDGTTIFSWGRHFPIAHYISKEVVLYNFEKCSNSTGRHQRLVLARLLDSKLHIIYCPKEIIIKAVDGFRVFQEYNPKIERIDQALDKLREVSKADGLKRFPYKKLYTMIMDKIVLESI